MIDEMLDQIVSEELTFVSILRDNVKPIYDSARCLGMVFGIMKNIRVFNNLVLFTLYSSV